jgi:hypothetical protein
MTIIILKILGLFCLGVFLAMAIAFTATKYIFKDDHFPF